MNGTEKMNKVWLLTSSSTELDATEPGTTLKTGTHALQTCKAPIKADHRHRKVLGNPGVLF